MLTRIKFISICFLFVLFMLWLISGEVLETGRNMNEWVGCDGYSQDQDLAPNYCN